MREIEMKTSLFALALATAPMLAMAPAFTAPAMAQSRADEVRWQEAQRRFDNERGIYERERARYEDARRYGRGGGYRGDRGGGYDERYGWRRDDSRDWEPSRYYREDPRYEERRLGAQDEVYRGADGRYYCRRSDGTTGLVIGAGVGALIGRGIDTRGERTTGTVVGGVLGALVGREVERSQDMRCR
jgi:opacity protein-like surface antigen